MKVFLNRLSKSGSKCIHEGDADLDGFRIAEEIGNCIPLKGVVACDVLKVASSEDGRELSAKQIKRATVFLSNPKYDDYEFADDIRCLIGRGKWIKQESFAEILKSRRVRGLITERIEKERLRGYRDNRRTKFRYRICDDAVAFVEWLAARRAYDLEPGGGDETGNLLDMQRSLVSELRRMLNRVDLQNLGYETAGDILFRVEQMSRHIDMTARAL